MDWNPFSWFTHGASDWFGSLGGSISSAIEGGFIAVLKDLWVVIGPWAKITLGIVLAIFAFAVYFKEDTIRFAGAAAGAAAMA